MARYRNGFVPAEMLVVFASGWNADGYWEHRLPPASYRKHLALVARAHARTGRWLQITPGWNCDRPYAIQVQARERHGVWAATPGQSSHGGTWAGPPTGWAWVDTAAIDYGNWSWVYQNHGGRAAWYDDCRAVGLQPGYISPPSFPDEPWHVVDTDPWAAVPSGNENFPEEEPMPTAEEIAKAVWHAITFKNGRTPGQELVRQGDRISRLELQYAELSGRGTGRYFKHGGRGVTLWVYVQESGDFVRIRDRATAELYKEINGASSVVVSGEALRLKIADLVAAGGRDLSAVPDSRETVPTPADAQVVPEVDA